MTSVLHRSVYYRALPPAWQLGVRVLAADLVLLAALILIPNNPKQFMTEGNVVTWLSVLHLGAAAWISRDIFRLRAREEGDRRGWLWALIGAGFLFLLLDEALSLHEWMDHGVHALFGLEENAFTARFDDYIIGIYGLIGLAVLYAFRTELLRYRRHVWIFVVGFVLLALSVLLDSLGHDNSVTALLQPTPRRAEQLRRWIEAMEESVKIFGEAVFLIAFLSCRDAARRLAGRGDAQQV